MTTVIHAVLLLTISTVYVILAVINTPAAEASAWAYALVASVFLASYHLRSFRA